MTTRLQSEIQQGYIKQERGNTNRKYPLYYREMRLLPQEMYPLPKVQINYNIEQFVDMDENGDVNQSSISDGQILKKSEVFNQNKTFIHENLRYYLKKPPAQLPKLRLDIQSHQSAGPENRKQVMDLDFSQPGQREILLNDTIPRLTKENYENKKYMYIDFEQRSFPGIKVFSNIGVRDADDVDRLIEANFSEQTAQTVQFVRQQKIHNTYKNLIQEQLRKQFDQIKEQTIWEEERKRLQNHPQNKNQKKDLSPLLNPQGILAPDGDLTLISDILNHKHQKKRKKRIISNIQPNQSIDTNSQQRIDDFKQQNSAAPLASQLVSNQTDTSLFSSINHPNPNNKQLLNTSISYANHPELVLDTEVNSTIRNGTILDSETTTTNARARQKTDHTQSFQIAPTNKTVDMYSYAKATNNPPKNDQMAALLDTTINVYESNNTEMTQNTPYNSSMKAYQPNSVISSNSTHNQTQMSRSYTDENSAAGEVYSGEKKKASESQVNQSNQKKLTDINFTPITRRQLDFSPMSQTMEDVDYLNDGIPNASPQKPELLHPDFQKEMEKNIKVRRRGESERQSRISGDTDKPIGSTVEVGKPVYVQEHFQIIDNIKRRTDNILSHQADTQRSMDNLHTNIQNRQCEIITVLQMTHAPEIIQSRIKKDFRKILELCDTTKLKSM